jgi:hypothetical protein
MSAGETGPPYRLNMNGWTRDELRRLIHRSVVVGVRDRFAHSLAEIESALQHRPREWGDPVATLQGLRLTRYRRVYDRLLVTYVVHLDQPIVWLLGVEPLKKSPMWLGEG